MTAPDGNVFHGPDGQTRCTWCGFAPEFLPYHDEEWGFPVIDDQRLFEKLCLEGFQAGLSWLTILKKRESFREAFANFDFLKVARLGPDVVDTLARNPGIVRHRGKIEATINNARRMRAIVDESGSFAAYVWRFEPDSATRPKRLTQDVMATLTTSPEAKALSKDLKRRGFSFVGPTTVYAFMQAMGLVNDHLDACVVRAKVERQRQTLVRPC